MPKIPMDYTKTIIYKLVCKNLNIKEIYVGHTTNWRQRKATHKSSIENINHVRYNCKKATYIREHGGWNTWSMIEIEKFPCNDEHEARSRERYWYETLCATLNSCNPCRSNKEWCEVNKEHLQEYKKEWNDKNKERISLKRAETFECECGAITTKKHKNRHFKTLKHCQFLETNNI